MERAQSQLPSVFRRRCCLFAHRIGLLCLVGHSLKGYERSSEDAGSQAALLTSNVVRMSDERISTTMEDIEPIRLGSRVQPVGDQNPLTGRFPAAFPAVRS